MNYGINTEILQNKIKIAMLRFPLFLLGKRPTLSYYWPNMKNNTLIGEVSGTSFNRPHDWSNIFPHAVSRIKMAELSACCVSVI